MNATERNWPLREVEKEISSCSWKVTVCLGDSSVLIPHLSPKERFKKQEHYKCTARFLKVLPKDFKGTEVPKGGPTTLQTLEQEMFAAPRLTLFFFKLEARSYSSKILFLHSTTPVATPISQPATSYWSWQLYGETFTHYQEWESN